MNLNLHTWKEFEMERLFNIKKGKRLTAADQEEGDNNYIGAIDSNNGVANHIGQKPIHSANTISLSYNGSVGEAFYQSEPYWATDDVNALYSYYEQFNKYIGLFMVAVIRQEKYKFSYGRKWTLDNMNKTRINLPIQHNADGTPFIDADKKYSDDGYIPDWQFMEDYIKSLHHKPLTTKNTVGNALALKVDEWEEFRVDDLFSVQLSKGDIKLDDMLIGDVPLVSSGETNNGVVGYIDSAGDGKAEIFSKNKITVDMFGNVYYQEDNFYAVSHGRVSILEPVFDMTKYIGLFIVSIINKEKFKYSYGRAVYSNVLCNVIIKLPIQHNADGTPYIDPDCTYSEEGYVPDWQFMEDYIKSLPYGDRI